MNPDDLKILVHGASGRMGRAVLRLAGERPGLRVVAAVSRSGEILPEAPEVPVLPVARLAEAPACDLVIDFSLPEAFDAALAACLARGAGLVSGTTGLSERQHAALDAAALQVPVLWAANFSAGVAVLHALVRQAAAALPSWDADIVESHHVHKKDAPSGTALTLGEAVVAGRGRAPHYASLRAGDIVGEHLVQFTGQGERLELVHRATNREIFARGALEAASRLARRGPGRYDFGQLLLADGRI
ncbi:4-hydroxy-tetrahydrodipicolinate reductase [Arenimonas caeni]|jgi:4-hydroxy-tetrahydrodipicolinate reductase|uniref:4-hydroxy-tetrahydrodipicolinate reductase n=1 Tax=Arenimonas caeni TaxID=2058085 RepID=A0A2P6M866_9GAMM|nr:4-hydroxy-tetrahydrodipicolinate reductase [Arenimonas caeni]MDY0020924.1 4-hydroxy-tetrahydrodipicolinate reductase [Arenimonas caeni]PRH82183.1 4-hydroxy-tetrahydrodipicolinate reductase [Arenimonas caeni]